MWEYFFDTSYDMWGVRHNFEKTFTAGIHVMTESEAKFLVEKLNELEKLKAEDFSDYFDSQAKEALDDPLKKLIESQLDIPADFKKMVDDNFSKLLWDAQSQKAPVEPLITCHNCGSTAGYYSLGKACKGCHCVA